MIIFAVLYGLIAKAAMPYILGAAYIESANMVMFFCIGYALSGCYLMVVNYISYSNKNEYLIFVVFLAGLFGVPLSYLLILNFGLHGAIYAFVISNMLVFVLGWYFSARAYKMNWLDFKS